MKLLVRPYRDEKDYWRIRQFFREVFLINGRREHSWPLYRWDYWMWHVNENIHHLPLNENIFIWETPEGRVAALLTPENTGEAHFHTHLAFRDMALEEEMLQTAEEHLTLTRPDGSRTLRVWAQSADSERQVLLANHGYTRQAGAEYQRFRELNQPIRNVPLAEGFSIRPLGDVNEFPARSWVSFKAFHADEPESNYDPSPWYHNIQRAPLYRRDLDLVVVAPNGELAAFCTLWFDDATRSAAFEPVGTHPAYQRLGLGKAIMTEGLNRVKTLGATLAAVGSYSPAAHALYNSLGFTQYTLSEPWRKLLN